MSDTFRASYVFTVKEFADGTPWIAFEPSGGNLNILKNGFLGFDLPKGTTYAKAKEIASLLNDNLGDLSYTNLP